MEELRDERLGKIVSWMQAYIRGYLSRKDYKKLQEQRLALVVVQRNLRKYLQLRTWPWWKLWQKIKPLLNVTRIEDELAVSVSSRFCQQIISFIIIDILRIKVIIKMFKLTDQLSLQILNLFYNHYCFSIYIYKSELSFYVHKKVHENLVTVSFCF